MSSQEIETERLVIRPLKDSDWEAVHLYSSDLEVCRFLEWGPNTPAQTRQSVRSILKLALERPRLNYDFGITLKGTDRVIGQLGLILNHHSQYEAQLGFLMAKESWANGYMSEAAKVVLNFGFAKLQLHRISALCDVDNTSSRRVLEKCGMRKEGHFRQDKYVKGRWRDTFFYSILSEEWHLQGWASD